MRVIGGTARGRRLSAPGLPALRPTSDRVREAIFDILEARSLVEGAAVLDVFAGSGALGIEALSRGAASATFLESDRRAVAAIEANLRSAGLEGPAARVVRADALDWLAAHPGSEGRFDVAFVDPPYRFEAWPALLRRLRAATLVLEHGAPIEVTGGYEVIRRYRYGGTLVTLAAVHQGGRLHDTDEDPA